MTCPHNMSRRVLPVQPVIGCVNLLRTGRDLQPVHMSLRVRPVQPVDKLRTQYLSDLSQCSSQIRICCLLSLSLPNHPIRASTRRLLRFHYSRFTAARRPSFGVHGCQMAKFDPFLSLDCTRVEGVGGAIQGKEGIKISSVAVA